MRKLFLTILFLLVNFGLALSLPNDPAFACSLSARSSNGRLSVTASGCEAGGEYIVEVFDERNKRVKSRTTGLSRSDTGFTEYFTLPAGRYTATVSDNKGGSLAGPTRPVAIGEETAGGGTGEQQGGQTGTAGDTGIDIGQKFDPPAYLQQTSGVGVLVSLILSNALILAGVLLLISVILGGFAVIRGAGSGDPKAGAQGKQAATASFIGFLIIFASYWIIRLVEFVTGAKITQ